MADPVFALHGWGLNAAVFRTLADCTTGREWVIGELPGHGRRGGVALGRDPDAVVRHLLDEAPERAVWLGWSLGGTLSLAAALIIVAASASFMARPEWPHGMPCERLEKMARELARDPDKTVNDFLATFSDADA